LSWLSSPGCPSLVVTVLPKNEVSGRNSNPTVHF
jgi:hypothetical protein